MRKIFITGGHFAPAKAVIQELLRRGQYEIYYLGRKYSLEESSALAFEYLEIQKLSQVKYLTITTGRLQRQFFVNIHQSIWALLKIFIGITQSLIWVIKFRPDIILSFGSYVAVPVALWAWLLGIPIFTHEQTTASGRANKLLSILADRILVSWPESLDQFPKNKTILTGNPIREEVLNQQPGPQPSHQQPVIYITGGSQGSLVIDRAVDEISPELENKYQVIHKQLSADQSAQALARADLVVSRAGANTITEILYLGKPSIIIPLPNTFNREQEKNAQLVVNSGIGQIISQQTLSGPKLQRAIDNMLRNKQKYLVNAKKARDLTSPQAAKLIADELEKIS